MGFSNFPGKLFGRTVAGACFRTLVVFIIIVREVFATHRSTKRQLLRKYSRKKCIEKIHFLVKLHAALPRLATLL